MWSYLAFIRAENDATRNKAMALRDALTSHMTPIRSPREAECQRMGFEAMLLLARKLQGRQSK
jgi:hypothetical protein